MDAPRLPKKAYRIINNYDLKQIARIIDRVERIETSHELPRLFRRIEK